MTSRTLKIALGLSVALNLLVAGAIGGALLSGGPDPQPQRGTSGPRTSGPLAPPEMRSLAFALSREDRRALRAALIRDRGLAQGRRDLQAHRLAVVDALRAVPFDPAVLSQALEQNRTRQTELAARGIALLTNVITEMSNADRAAYADRVEAGLQRRGGPRR